MVPKLEAMKGGGGSIKVGTTGTISNLMSRELVSPKPSLPHIKVSTFSESVSVSCHSLTPRKPKPKTSINSVNRIKPHSRRSSHLPILEADDVSIEATPHRGKVERKGVVNIVEIVDIKCGHPDRAWATPITKKLKKLGFSKLSESSIF